jgi:hypothetical protein
MRHSQIDGTGTLLPALCELPEVATNFRVIHGGIGTEGGCPKAPAMIDLCLASLHLRQVRDLGNGLLAVGTAENQITELPTHAFEYGVKTHF